MNFGKTLRLLRQNHKLSQSELSRIFNISQSTIANYELCKKEPNFDMLLKLAKYFNVSVDYLLGNTNPIKVNVADLNIYKIVQELDYKYIELAQYLSDERINTSSIYTFIKAAKLLELDNNKNR